MIWKQNRGVSIDDSRVEHLVDSAVAAMVQDGVGLAFSGTGNVLVAAIEDGDQIAIYHCIIRREAMVARPADPVMRPKPRSRR